MLLPTGLIDRIGEEHVFPTLPTAVDAYRRWSEEQRLTSSPRCDVREVRPLGGPGTGSRPYVEDN